MIFESNKFLKLAPDAGSATTYNLSAGTTDVNTTPVDSWAHQGREIGFIVDIGAIAANGIVTIKAQHSDDNVNYFDIEGTSQATTADTDDDLRLGLQINRITKRYVRLAIVRGDGGNSSITLVQAIIGGLKTKPCTQSLAAGQFKRQPEIFGGAITGTA